MKIYFDSEFTGLSKDDDLISIGLLCRSNPGTGKENVKFHSFYGVINDFDMDKCDDWVKSNVVDILKNDSLTPQNKIWLNKGSVEQNRVYGTFEFVSNALNTWIETLHEIEVENEERTKQVYVEFVSDVSSYDFVHIVDLLTMHGSSLDLPTYIVPYCIDIMPDVKRLLPLCGCDDSWYHAFNDNRENIVHTIMTTALKFNQQYIEDNLAAMQVQAEELEELKTLITDLWDEGKSKKRRNAKKEVWEDCVISGAKHNALFDATIIYAIEFLRGWVDTYLTK